MRGSAASLWTVAPHRLTLAFLVGAAWAVSSSASVGGGFAAGGGFAERYLPAAIAVVAATGATGLVRLWFLKRSASWIVRGTIAAAAAASAVGSIAILTGTGAFLAALLALLVVALEATLPFARVRLAGSVPADAVMVFTEGVLVPAVAYAALIGGWHLPWALVAVTAPASAGLVIAGALGRGTGASAPVKTLTSRLPPLAAAVLSVGFVGVAIGLVLTGGGPGLDPERSLLASPVAIMCVVFAMLALADPRPEWRSRRVELLVTASVVSLYLGLVLVLVVA